MKLGTIAERLGRNRYDLGASSHIEVDQAAARATGAGRLLERVCPAGVYSVGPDGALGVLWAACLECGTCLAVAPPGVLTWHYPAGGAGVAYRQG
ncbi:MAG: 4Fe-4S dicluster domain-containing protein [Bifidobacteriaceae bacterium]|jgi:ferredoxin like protein|nr:4Fe-4S dicluster domain-containing protein [Bifidobacteriaceae bacterium]